MILWLVFQLFEIKHHSNGTGEINLKFFNHFSNLILIENFKTTIYNIFYLVKFFIIDKNHVHPLGQITPDLSWMVPGGNIHIRNISLHNVYQKNFSNRMLWLKKLCKNNWILWHGRVTEYHIDMTWSCYWRDIYLLQIDLTIRYFLDIFFKIRVITKLPNSEQSYKGKVKTRKYINRQNQSTIDSILSPSVVIQCVTVSDDLAW